MLPTRSDNMRERYRLPRRGFGSCVGVAVLILLALSSCVFPLNGTAVAGEAERVAPRNFSGLVLERVPVDRLRGGLAPLYPDEGTGPAVMLERLPPVYPVRPAAFVADDREQSEAQSNRANCFRYPALCSKTRTCSSVRLTIALLSQLGTPRSTWSSR